MRCEGWAEKDALVAAVASAADGHRVDLGAPDAARGRIQEAMTIVHEAGMLPESETWQDIRRLQDRLSTEPPSPS